VTTTRSRPDWIRLTAYGLLPALALLLAMAAGAFKYVDNSVRESAAARAASVQAAKASTAAILSYTPDQVDRQLNEARRLLTGDFLNQYTDLIDDEVIPIAKQRMVTAVATVPAAAVISADPNHAVVLIYVNQTVIVGGEAPAKDASSVRVTMDEVGGRWLISAFEPIRS
jgi:Mce-associated membrane protein